MTSPTETTEATGTLTLKEGVDYDVVNGEIVLRKHRARTIKAKATPAPTGQFVGKHFIRGSRYGRVVHVVTRETPTRIFHAPVREDGVVRECSVSDALDKTSRYHPHFFASHADAQAAIATAKVIEDEYAPLVNAARAEEERLHEERDRKVGAALEGVS